MHIWIGNERLEKYFKNKCFDIRKNILKLARNLREGSDLGGTMSCVRFWRSFTIATF